MSILRVFATASFFASLVACTPPAVAPKDPTTTQAETAKTGKTDAEELADGSEAASPKKAANLPKLTLEKLQGAVEMGGFYDEKLEKLTAAVGAPTAKGEGLVRMWWYDKRPISKTATSCSTMDLVQLPSGKAIENKSVYTADDCKKTSLTGAKVEVALKDLADRDFAKVNKKWEASLGKPAREHKSRVAAWRYTDDNEECKMLVVYEDVLSKSAQDVWEVPCE
jgi:hypothetical protein